MSNPELNLPVSRVRIIMKSSPEVDIIKQDSLFLVTRLTELFLADLTKRAFSKCKGYTLDYQHIADIVQSDDKFDFLRQIIPRKITMKEFREIMAKKAEEDKQRELDSEESEVDEEDIKIVIEDSS